MTRTAFKAEWTALRDQFSRYGASVDGASICAAFLAGLEVLWADEDREWIGVSEANRRTEYDESSLRRMAREGTVTAEKRGRSWWFLAGSLLRKASKGAGLVSFDPAKAVGLAVERAMMRAIGHNSKNGGNDVDQEAA